MSSFSWTSVVLFEQSHLVLQIFTNTKLIAGHEVPVNRFAGCLYLSICFQLYRFAVFIDCFFLLNFLTVFLSCFPRCISHFQHALAHCVLADSAHCPHPNLERQKWLYGVCILQHPQLAYNLILLQQDLNKAQSFVNKRPLQRLLQAPKTDHELHHHCRQRGRVCKQTRIIIISQYYFSTVFLDCIS